MSFRSFDPLPGSASPRRSHAPRALPRPSPGPLPARCEIVGLCLSPASVAAAATAAAAAAARCLIYPTEFPSLTQYRAQYRSLSLPLLSLLPLPYNRKLKRISKTE